jgi:hypothetical protein
MSKSGQLKIYKSTGAAQLSLIECRRDDRGFVTKEGAVLVEVAKCNGKDAEGNILADWANKLNFAINISDLCNLMDEYNTKGHRLFHKFRDDTKSLEFKPGSEKFPGTYMLQVQVAKDSISVPLTNGEYNMIMNLLMRVAAPQLIGWN